ncbi:MAG: DUF4358 domain-containing protein [Erysipelotrichaceae bacterium]
MKKLLLSVLCVLSLVALAACGNGGTKSFDADGFKAKAVEDGLVGMSKEMDDEYIKTSYFDIKSISESVVVVRNMISPGGQEIAIIKPNEGKTNDAKELINKRKEYGLKEQAFYPNEQELFESSEVVEAGGYLIYICNGQVEETKKLIDKFMK